MQHGKFSVSAWLFLSSHHGKSTSDIMLNLVITSWKFLFHFIYYESVYIGSWQFCHAIFKKIKLFKKKYALMTIFVLTSWQIYFTHHGKFSYYIMAIFIPFYLPWNFFHHHVIEYVM